MDSANKEIVKGVLEAIMSPNVKERMKRKKGGMKVVELGIHDIEKPKVIELEPEEENEEMSEESGEVEMSLSDLMKRLKKKARK